MRFYSTKNQKISVNFEAALLSGMAEDGGLFMPEKVPQFSESEIEKMTSLSFPEVAFLIAQEFVGKEIPKEDLKKICEEAYDFPIPIKELETNHLVLELFHGPTLAFKDFAARFMARCVSYFLSKKKVQKNILVATSGDTGGAIGNGFLGLPNVNIFILYPKGGVSPVQEKQLTTMGQNIQAIEIDGTFDDCQRLVKEMFTDKELNDRFSLMSANSINVGRVIPQSFYYFWTSLQLQKKETKKNIIYSVPSGNFGNIFGGILAKYMGAPIHKFIVANNANHPFFDFLKTGEFSPVNSCHTLSNAMDIGHPNNYYRIYDFFKKDIEKIREVLWGCWFNDTKTAEIIAQVFREKNYLMCPHTAVACLGVESFKKESMTNENLYVTVSTAHPAKFIESVETIIKSKIALPEELKSSMEKEKKSTILAPQKEALVKYLTQKS